LFLNNNPGPRPTNTKGFYEPHYAFAGIVLLTFGAAFLNGIFIHRVVVQAFSLEHLFVSVGVIGGSFLIAFAFPKKE